MCTYWHVTDEDTNETVATFTDPLKAQDRAIAEEARTGHSIIVNVPATLNIRGAWFRPGQLISVEEI